MPSQSEPAWTPEEIAIEHEYRRQERIGISCGEKQPSTAVLALARREADEWVAKLLTYKTKQNQTTCKS